MNWQQAGAVEALSLVERISAVGVAVSCLEILAFPRPLRPDGIMSWEVSRLRNALFVRPRLEGLLNRLFAYRTAQFANAVRLAAAVALAFGFAGAWGAPLAWVVALAGIGFSIRSPYGLDGADQLYVLTFCGIAIARTVGGETAAQLCLWWIAGHMTVAYLTSGVAKLLSPIWRSGAAIPGVFGTVMYGWPRVAKWLKARQGLCRVAAFGVIVGEIALPLCLVAPTPVSVALLASGVFFHGAAALVMGLNSFFWAFVATYPAFLYASSWARLALY